MPPTTLFHERRMRAQCQPGAKPQDTTDEFPRYVTSSLRDEMRGIPLRTVAGDEAVNVPAGPS
jgi:hypothetical protein